MKNLRFLPIVASVMLLALACSVSAPATTQAPTQAPTTLPATATLPLPPAATATPIDGKVVSIGGVWFTLLNQVADGVSSQTTDQLELPYINGSIGPLPVHTVLTLNDYRALGAYQGTPKIIVFRAAEYDRFDTITSAILAALQAPYVEGQPLPEALGKSGLNAQAHGLIFQNGHGVRVLDKVMTGIAPVTNADLFYFFRGVTNDGQYFVQVELPIQAAFLAADSNPNTPLPADGIPFTPEEFDGYIQLVRQRLNAADPSAFTPTLDLLDGLVQSLLVDGL